MSDQFVGNIRRQQRYSEGNSQCIEALVELYATYARILARVHTSEDYRQFQPELIPIVQKLSELRKTSAHRFTATCSLIVRPEERRCGQ